MPSFVFLFNLVYVFTICILLTRVDYPSLLLQIYKELKMYGNKAKYY